MVLRKSGDTWGKNNPPRDVLLVDRTEKKGKKKNGGTEPMGGTGKNPFQSL